jgi:hypothetical protein
LIKISAVADRTGGFRYIAIAAANVKARKRMMSNRFHLNNTNSKNSFVASQFSLFSARADCAG